jgi:hypothetical protein
MQVGVGWLDRFIADSIRQNIIIPGESDFVFYAPDNQLEIMLCHEGDIHTGGSDLGAQRKLWAFHPFCTYPLVREPSHTGGHDA